MKTAHVRALEKAKGGKEMGSKSREIYHNAPSHNTTMKSIARKFVRGDTRSASHRRRQDKAYDRVMGLDK